jgi:hypothetical protein
MEKLLELLYNDILGLVISPFLGNRKYFLNGNVFFNVKLQQLISIRSD